MMNNSFFVNKLAYRRERKATIPDKHRAYIGKEYDNIISEVELLLAMVEQEQTEDFMLDIRRSLSAMLETAVNLQGRYDAVKFIFDAKYSLSDIHIVYTDSQSDTRYISLKSLFKIGRISMESIWVKVQHFSEFDTGYKDIRVLVLGPDNSPNFPVICSAIHTEIQEDHEIFYYRGGRNRSGVTKRIAGLLKPIYKYIKRYPEDFPEPLRFLNNLFDTSLSERYLK